MPKGILQGSHPLPRESRRRDPGPYPCLLLANSVRLLTFTPSSQPLCTNIRRTTLTPPSAPDNSVVHNRPIVSNKEAIAINQAWAGDAGRLANQSVDQTTLPNCGSGTPCKHSRWMVWTKALPAGAAPAGAQSQSRAAVLLMNNGDTTTSVSLPDLSTVRVL